MARKSSGLTTKILHSSLPTWHPPKACPSSSRRTMSRSESHSFGSGVDLRMTTTLGTMAGSRSMLLVITLAQATRIYGGEKDSVVARAECGREPVGLREQNNCTGRPSYVIQQGGRIRGMIFSHEICYMDRPICVDVRRVRGEVVQHDRTEVMVDAEYLYPLVVYPVRLPSRLSRGAARLSRW